MVASHTEIPLHTNLPSADELPWTISYVIRKRSQIDSFSEVPKEKRPPDRMIWYGRSEDIDVWFDKVLRGKKDKQPQDEFVFVIDEDDIG